MAFNVKIQNLGKLDDAEIRIDRFTVFAGPNNSGKSFVSKTVYSVIKALSENFVNQYFLRLINNLDSDLFLPGVCDMVILRKKKVHSNKN